MTSLIEILSCAKSFANELQDAELKHKATRCISIAAHGFETCDGEFALHWLLKSLRHSIGELHPAYVEALKYSAPSAQ